MITTSWTLPMLPTPVIPTLPYNNQQPTPPAYNPQQSQAVAYPVPYYRAPIYPVQTIPAQFYPQQQQAIYTPPQQATIQWSPSTLVSQPSRDQFNTNQKPTNLESPLPISQPLKSISPKATQTEAQLMANIIEEASKKYPQLKQILSKERLEQLQTSVTNPNQSINDLLMNLVGAPIKNELQHKSWFRRRAAKTAMTQLERFLSKAAVIPGPTQAIFQDFLKNLQDKKTEALST